MQEQLNAAYEEFKHNTIIPPRLATRLSPPLLLKIPEQYLNSNRRILIVGQETLGWDFRPVHNFVDFNTIPNSVEMMTQAYQNFEFSLRSKRNYRSPFWQAYRKMRIALGENKRGFQTSVLWTNLFRMSLDGGSVVKKGSREDANLIRDAGRSLLLSEIAILEPDAIIFFTGPNYDPHLNEHFRDCQRSAFNGHDIAKACILSHPRLPNDTWRTYHPRYLRHARLWHIVDEITAAAA